MEGVVGIPTTENTPIVMQPHKNGLLKRAWILVPSAVTFTCT